MVLYRISKLILSACVCVLWLFKMAVDYIIKETERREDTADVCVEYKTEAFTEVWPGCNVKSLVLVQKVPAADVQTSPPRDAQSCFS